MLTSSAAHPTLPYSTPLQKVVSPSPETGWSGVPCLQGSVLYVNILVRFFFEHLPHVKHLEHYLLELLRQSSMELGQVKEEQPAGLPRTLAGSLIPHSGSWLSGSGSWWLMPGKQAAGVHCSEGTTAVREERPVFTFKLYHLLPGFFPQAGYVNIRVVYPDFAIVKIKSRDVFKPHS